MQVIGPEALAAALDPAALVGALRRAFAEAAIEAPPRSAHSLADGRGGRASLLVMPAWRAGASIGVKIVAVFPQNPSRGLPSLNGAYLLVDGRTGRARALLDGPTLTRLRTGAASALAAGYLARKDASRLVVVGTGALAPELARAHAVVRPISAIRVWGRRPARARRLARHLRAAGLPARATGNLEAAVRQAEIVSCATLATAPLVKGAWLAPGTHLDLVGSFRPDMCEADDEALVRARVFVDTRSGALAEAGEIVGALSRGAIGEEHIEGELADLVTGRVAGRNNAGEITLFKSVGCALEDLVAAELALRRLRRAPTGSAAPASPQAPSRGPSRRPAQRAQR